MHFHSLMYIGDGTRDKDKEMLTVFEAAPNVLTYDCKECEYPEAFERN